MKRERERERGRENERERKRERGEKHTFKSLQATNRQRQANKQQATQQPTGNQRAANRQQAIQTTTHVRAGTVADGEVYGRHGVIIGRVRVGAFLSQQQAHDLGAAAVLEGEVERSVPVGVHCVGD